jgi:hypothetical protein
VWKEQAGRSLRRIAWGHSMAVGKGILRGAPLRIVAGALKIHQADFPALFCSTTLFPY